MEFRTYDFKVESVAKTGDGYLLQHAGGVTKIEDNGELKWELNLEDVPDLPNGYKANQIITVGNKFWLLGSITSEPEIDLSLISISASGEPEWQKVHRITDSYEKPQTPTFHADHFLNYAYNNYARAVDNGDGTVKLIFSYDLNLNEARYQLLSLSETGEILIEIDSSTSDARGRIFSIEALSGGRLIALLGIDSRVEIKIFNSLFEEIDTFRFLGQERPTLINVLEVQGGLYLTGHDEYGDNPAINSNYDIVVLNINSEGGMHAESHGRTINRELSAMSFLDDQGKLFILAVRRADNGLTPSKESDLLLLEYNTATGSFSEIMLVEDHGMEGIYASLEGNVLTVIGYKTGFSQADEPHSFYTKFKFN